MDLVFEQQFKPTWRTGTLILGLWKKKWDLGRITLLTRWGGLPLHTADKSERPPPPTPLGEADAPKFERHGAHTERRKATSAAPFTPEARKDKTFQAANSSCSVKSIDAHVCVSAKRAKTIPVPSTSVFLCPCRMCIFEGHHRVTILCQFFGGPPTVAHFDPRFNTRPRQRRHRQRRQNKTSVVSAAALARSPAEARRIKATTKIQYIYIYIYIQIEFINRRR